MRDIGVHFNVNKMLSCDAYTSRLASGGLTFFEMGYMLMQAYDFVYLNKHYGCRVEFGGSDQWANIVAGADLGRKLSILEGKDPETFQAFTHVLLLNAEGKKMGKTAKGALWVNKEKCSPYDFYQYFYNCDDRDVEKLFKILTYLPLDEIAEIMNGDIRDAKRRLAFEITKLVHGEEEAKNAEETAKALFSGGIDLENAPTLKISEFLNMADLLVLAKFASSKGEARRLIEQGGITLNNEKVDSFNRTLTAEDFEKGYALLKKGKKSFIKIVKE